MNAVIDFMAGLFAVPFGYILSALYTITNNYVISLILITLIVRFSLLPIDLYKRKKKREEKETKARIKAVKEKYAGNSAKIKEEIALIEEDAPSEIKGLGFITFFFQLFVLVGLLNVLNAPLTNILGFDETTINSMKTVMAEPIKASGEINRVEIVMLEESINYKEILLNSEILTEQEMEKIITLHEKFNLFGINLSLKPQIKEVNELWLFPIAFAVVMLLSNVQNFILLKKTGALKGPLAILAYLPIIMTALFFLMFFAFPVGIIFYFTLSNLISYIQRVIITKVFTPKNKSQVASAENNTTELTEENTTQQTPTNTSVLPEGN